MIDVLKKIHLFENLTERELEKIFTMCMKQTFAKDAVIFKEGEPGDRCYIITTGAVVSARSSRTPVRKLWQSSNPEITSAKWR